MVPVVSIYNCILGCPTLAALDAVMSTDHLKMKYHNKSGEIVTIHADLNDAKRCHKAWGKLPALQYALILKGTVEPTSIPRLPMLNCNNTNLDARQGEKHLKNEKGQEMEFPLEAKLPFERPTTDGEFKFVQLDDNPAMKVKIGVNLPSQVEEDLIECLRANADLFACSLGEMFRIDPSFACHKLNVNPDAKFVS